MNGLFKKAHVLLFIAFTMVIQTDAANSTRRNPRKQTAARRRSSTNRPNRSRAAVTIAKVNKTTSISDQIFAQAEIICNATGPTAHKQRAEAKAEINRLIKQLDQKVVNMISDDITIINSTGKTAESKADAKEALQRLKASLNETIARANAAKTAEIARRKIEAAAPQEKQAAIAEGIQNMKAAESEVKQASLASQALGLITTPFTAPFDSERSAASRAFWAAVGLTALGGGAYAGYQYGIPAAQAAYAAATWENIKGAPSAAWNKTSELGSRAWNAATNAFGYWNNGSAMLSAATTALGLAQTGYVKASEALKKDPTNVALKEEKAKAFDAMLDASQKVEKIKQLEANIQANPELSVNKLEQEVLTRQMQEEGLVSPAQEIAARKEAQRALEATKFATIEEDEDFLSNRQNRSYNRKFLNKPTVEETAQE